jgi:1-acyl-sn-glycerol-3-phosphate acyltransferase
MSDRWHRILSRVLSHAYYRRVAVVELAREAPRGAVLYVGLHRNGAVDGLIYKRCFPRATFLISSQLTRSRFGRIFFTGIPVTRANDRGDRAMNAASLDRCVAHLVEGRELFVLPEGTSDLGPRHLPFKPGAARILERALASGVDVAVVPVGIFYAAADAFRSDVTVVRGHSISTELPRCATPDERCDVLMARITAALETIGVNVACDDELSRIEAMSALAAESPGAEYYGTLAQLARADMPDDVAAAWAAVNGAMKRGAVVTHHGAPVLSSRGLSWNVAWLALQSVITAAAAIINLPPIAVARLAGRRIADGRNTIALWRLLAGSAAAGVWISFLAIGSSISHHASWIFAYATLTLAGLVTYPELRARWPRFRNSALRPELKREIERLRDWAAPLGSRAPRRTRILAHEAAFGLLYGLVIGRLLTSAKAIAWGEIAVWSVFAAVSAALVVMAERVPSSLAWRVRLAAYLVLMNLAYARMGIVHRQLGTALGDVALQGVDRTLFGIVLPLSLDGWTSPAASQFFSICYFLLFPYIVISCARQIWRYERAPDEARRFFAGLFTVYAIGFAGYLLVPAAGPYIAMPGAFAHPITGGGMTALNGAVIQRGSNHVDVFPSLHVAVSAFFLGFDRRFARWRFVAYALPACGLWVSTLYLRYHYGIDVLCGFALAGLGLSVALRGAETRPEHT